MAHSSACPSASHCMTILVSRMTNRVIALQQWDGRRLHQYGASSCCSAAPAAPAADPARGQGGGGPKKNSRKFDKCSFSCCRLSGSARLLWSHNERGHGDKTATSFSTAA